MTDNKLNTCEMILAVTSVITTVIAIFSLGLVYQQLQESKFTLQNANASKFNEIYDSWYSKMPSELKSCPERETVKWNSLEPDDKAWIRQYFNLYSQEYDSYKKGLIPPEMWEVTIHGTKGCKGAAILNLHEYPVLLEG